MSNTYSVSEPVAKFTIRKKTSEKSFLFIDKLLYGFIFIIVFLPQPTIGGVAGLMAPAVISLLLLLSIMYFIVKGVPFFLNNQSLNIFLTMLFIIACLAARIMIRQEGMIEFKYLLGRILTCFMIFVFLTWMNYRKPSIEAIFRTIFWSVIFVGLLASYFGIRGGGNVFIFGGGEHSREFTEGVSVGLYKSQGIQRSFGEFGIFLSAAWAYFLVFRKNHSFFWRTTGGTILALAIIVSQSRSTWLAILLLTATFFFIKWGAKKLSISLILLIIIFLPVVTAVLTTAGKNLPGVNHLIGEGIYQKNVDVRHTVDLMALKLFYQKPLQMVWGISHSDWGGVFSKYDVMVGLHNNFLSNLVFLGLLAGIPYLLLIFIPVIKLLSFPDYQEKEFLLMFLSTIGFITCLHYYEGYFSPISSLLIASLWYATAQNDSGKLPYAVRK